MIQPQAAHHRALLILAVITLFALVVSAAAGQSEEQPIFSVYNGDRTYATYCSNCHGDGGEGDGYIADSLKTKPADLTRIAERNSGVFLAERVAAAIDGQVEIKLHGRREMPVWGDVFLWPESDSAERREQVRIKIGELVEYLRSIQKP